MAIERYGQNAPLARSSLARRTFASLDTSVGKASPLPVLSSVEMHSGARDTLIDEREPDTGRDIEMVQVLKAEASRVASTKMLVSRQRK